MFHTYHIEYEKINSKHIFIKQKQRQRHVGSKGAKILKYILLVYNIYIYIYIVGSSYTFSKPLDLSKSNVQKNTLINTNILIRISFIILIYNIPYLSLIPKICIFFSLLSLSHLLHVSLSMFFERCHVNLVPFKGLFEIFFFFWSECLWHFFI